MDYRRFERLVIVGTSALVLIGLVASLVSGVKDVTEVFGQLAIVGVIAVAVHWGRRGGTFAALAACIAYLVLWLPMLSVGLPLQGLTLVISRFAGYCFIGIVGGEVFGRMKYLLAGSKQHGTIDDWSQVYNQQYIARSLERSIERHSRYEEPFSMIVVSLESALNAIERPMKLRAMVRSIANVLREDVRMVDDVARLDDGRFVVMLPHTPGQVAPLVAERLSEAICRTLSIKESSVATMCLAAQEDSIALAEFAVSIAYPRDEPVAQVESGE